MTLAYLDSFAGIIPCRIVAVGDWNDSGSEARIQITTNRKGYQRGEVLTVTLRNVVPRNAIKRRNGALMIKRYQWPNAARSTL